MPDNIIPKEPADVHSLLRSVVAGDVLHAGADWQLKTDKRREVDAAAAQLLPLLTGVPAAVAAKLGTSQEGRAALATAKDVMGRVQDYVESVKGVRAVELHAYGDRKSVV